VWSLDWWHDPEGQTRRLLAAIEASREEARQARPALGPGANASGPASPAAGAAPEARPAARPDVRAVTFARYVPARLRPRAVGIQASSPNAVARLFREVLEQEGPLHEDDLVARALAAHGHVRAGKNIRRLLDAALEELRDLPGVERAEGSWRLAGAAVRPRQRSTVAVPAERIPAWEVDAAVLEVLAQNRSLPEDEVVALVRDGFGYGSASPRLRAAVAASLERLRQERRLGLGSQGVARLDRPAEAPAVPAPPAPPAPPTPRPRPDSGPRPRARAGSRTPLRWPAPSFDRDDMRTSLLRVSLALAGSLLFAACGMGGALPGGSGGTGSSGGGGGTGGGGTPVQGTAAQEYNLARLNHYRGLVGAPALVLDAQLNAFATQGSQELLQNHVPHGHFANASNAGTLFTTDGFQGYAAENQGDPGGWPPGTIEAQIDQILAAMWAEGPGGGHYENMIRASLRRVGIGLVLDGNGELYFTNDFSN
jgi:uncharacterized protein YkwD